MQKRRNTLKDLDFLLGDLGRELGFSNRLTARELLPPGMVLSDIEFACAVLRAENMNPDYEPKWVLQIREKFAALRPLNFISGMNVGPRPQPGLKHDHKFRLAPGRPSGESDPPHIADNILSPQ
jgi:hypothetical protein